MTHAPADLCLPITLTLSAVANWYNADTLTSSPSQLNFLVFASLWSLVSVGYIEGASRFVPRGKPSPDAPSPMSDRRANRGRRSVPPARGLGHGADQRHILVRRLYRPRRISEPPALLPRYRLRRRPGRHRLFRLPLCRLGRVGCADGKERLEGWISQTLHGGDGELAGGGHPNEGECSLVAALRFTDEPEWLGPRPGSSQEWRSSRWRCCRRRWPSLVLVQAAALWTVCKKDGRGWGS